MMPLEGNHIEGVLMEKAETKCLFSNVLFVMLKVNQVLLRYEASVSRSNALMLLHSFLVRGEFDCLCVT